MNCVAQTNTNTITRDLRYSQSGLPVLQLVVNINMEQWHREQEEYAGLDNHRKLTIFNITSKKMQNRVYPSSENLTFRLDLFDILGLVLNSKYYIINLRT